MFSSAPQQQEASTGSRADGQQARDPSTEKGSSVGATTPELPETFAGCTAAEGIAPDPPRGGCRPRAGIRLGVPLCGRIERLVQGRRYAFVRLQDGRSIYAHWSALRRIRFSELRPRQFVWCWLEIGGIGLQAARVEPGRSWCRARKKRARGEGTSEKAATRAKTPPVAVVV